MGVVAVGLVAAVAAAAQGDAGLLAARPAQRVLDPELPHDDQRAVVDRDRDRGLLRLFLRTAVEALVAQRAGGAALDGACERVGVGGLDVDPRAPRGIEGLRQGRDAAGGVDAARRVPADRDAAGRIPA